MKAFQLLVAFLLVVLFYSCHSKRYYDSKFEISFDKTDSLYIGSSIYFKAVPAGKIIAISKRKTKTLVQVEMKRWARIPIDSRFELKPNSLGKESIIVMSN